MINAVWEPKKKLLNVQWRQRVSTWSLTRAVHGRARHLCGLSTRRKGAREAVMNRSTDLRTLALHRLSHNGVLRGAAQSGGALLHQGGVRRTRRGRAREHM